jgi:STAM-binding protein
MDSRIAMRPTRPQTVKELVAQAENFKFNTNIPVKHWIRAAETLYQEVCC